MGPGGMVSFGHAAYFGLGAYGAGLLVKHLAAPMELGAARRAAAARFAGALLFGWFCVRLAGVYLAMLSLAFAQIVYADRVPVVRGHRRRQRPGRRSGPSAWASRTIVYYYFALASERHRAASAAEHRSSRPSARRCGPCRDSPLRAEAIGIDIRTHQWLAFTHRRHLRRARRRHPRLPQGHDRPDLARDPAVDRGPGHGAAGRRADARRAAGRRRGLPRARDLVRDAHPLLAADPRADHRRASCWRSRTASSAGCSAAAARPRPPDGGPRGHRACARRSAASGRSTTSASRSTPASCSP